MRGYMKKLSKWRGKKQNSLNNLNVFGEKGTKACGYSIVGW